MFSREEARKVDEIIIGLGEICADDGQLMEAFCGNVFTKGAGTIFVNLREDSQNNSPLMHADFNADLR